MRPILLIDLDMAARMLQATAPAQRARRAQQLCLQAHAADKYRKRFGFPHATFGDGSLYSCAALAKGGHGPQAITADYLGCLAHVVAALRGRNLHQIH